MTELERVRSAIDAVDAELTALFEYRMDCAAKLGAYKQARGLPVRDPAREAALLARGETLLHDPSLQPYYRELWRRLLALSRLRQRALTALPPEPEAAQWLLPLGEQGCEITLCRGLLAKAGRRFRLDRRVLVVTDEGVPPDYAAAVAAQCAAPTVVTLPQGEAGKCLAQYERLVTAMLEGGFTRDDGVAAVGGGMVCDLAGFAAATYQRGVDCCYVPTTLLAQIDASVGGKTALNLGGVKNQLGVFSQPRSVLIDPDLLRTLPPRQLSNGLAEALKIAVCFDPALFTLLETQDLRSDPAPVIEPCLRHKIRLVLEDERDEGPRRLLNFGHTLGHGLEAVTGLLHGECVALGMLPMCGPALRARLLPVLERLGLPTQVKADPEAVLKAALHDKKRAGDGVRIVTAQEPGCCKLETVSAERLRERLLSLFDQGTVL